MTSIVAEVLIAAGILSHEDMPTKVKNLKQKVEDIKFSVLDSLKSKYIDYVPQYLNANKLSKNLQAAEEEYKMLYVHFEKEIKPQMNNSAAEFHEMFDDLKKIQTLRTTAYNLIEMNQHLDQSKTSLRQKSYLIATENLIMFDTKFKQLSHTSQKEIGIFNILRIEFISHLEAVTDALLKLWQQNVSICQPSENPNEQRLSVIKKPSEEFIDVTISLAKLQQLDSELTSFGKQFLQLIVEPLVSESAEVSAKNTPTTSIFELKIVSHDTPPPLNAVFEHLTNLFCILATAFSEVPLDKHPEAKTVMMQFGELMSADFCDLLVEKCLMPSVPSHSKQLDKFQKDLKDISDFVDQLFHLGFLSSNENSLMQFLGKVDDLPANKMAMDLLIQARKLMKEDLYPIVMVGTSSTTPSDDITQEQTSEVNQVDKAKNVFSGSSFEFPNCKISASAKTLVKLLQDIMVDVKQLESEGQTNSYIKLFFTARNICVMYICVMPTLHRDEIANIPQQAAIHHNNCMYIAHCLLTLGTQYKLEHCCPTFVDQIPDLRKIGTEAFLAQMRIQRQHIIHLLQDSDAFQNVLQEVNLQNKAEKAVRQCLQQLQLLKQVWSNVLPVKVYYKAIGTLLNTLLAEIISHICFMEDIAAQTASQLDSVFDIVIKESPDLFQIEREKEKGKVHSYVKWWMKFQELQLVLVASLRDIVDRWSSGKGPLAAFFTADEVKHLIRALFQNTERRAAALGKIQ